MIYRYHLEALEEYEDAIKYYQEKAGLGERFSNAIENGIQKIIDHPCAWQMIGDGVRRHVVNSFPFCIYYIIDEQTIYILAIFHTKRKPGAWQQRLKR